MLYITTRARCKDGQTRTVRLRLARWGELDVVDAPYGVDFENSRPEILEALEQTGVPAVQVLIQALTDNSQYTRRGAAKALGNIGSAEAVPALLEALSDWDYVVRKYAAKALGAIGDPSAVPALLHALTDIYYDVIEAAAEALGAIGDPSAVPALSVWAHAGEEAARDALQMLKHPAIELRQAVAQLAAQNDWGVIIRALPCKKVRKAVVKLGILAVPALVNALRFHSNEMVRGEAARALGEIWSRADDRVKEVFREEDAIGWLRAKTYDASHYVRPIAAWALGKIGDPEAVPTLIEVQRYCDDDLRREALKALGKIGDHQAIPALIDAAQRSRCKKTRRTAKRALAKLR